MAGRAFCNLSNLTTLDISYNKLPTLELDNECHLPKLAALNISGNVQLDLLNLMTFFGNVKQLRVLAMADIGKLPLDIFASLNNLEALNVSGTRLGNDTSLILEPIKSLKVNFDFFKLKLIFHLFIPTQAKRVFRKISI